MEKKGKTAVIYPKPGTKGKPVTVLWKTDDFGKIAETFAKIVRKALDEKPPKYYKQIIFFYEGEDLKYLKPFNAE